MDIIEKFAIPSPPVGHEHYEYVEPSQGFPFYRCACGNREGSLAWLGLHVIEKRRLQDAQSQEAA